MIAGIDGGGTSTRLELRDDQNHTISRMQFSAFNITSIGEDAFRALIRRLGEAGVAQADRVCIGGAGVSYGGLRELILEELDAQGFAGQLKLCTDCEIALRGAMDGPGCVLIAGTGSIGFGVNAAGEQARCGGFGHLIDDGGSGYAIGRDALSLAVQTLDGRSDARMLTEAILDAIKVSDAAGIVEYVYRSGAGKAEIAALAKTVLRCAGSGDAASLAILQRNAETLRQIVEALSKRLQLPMIRTALLGGAIAEDNLYRRMVQSQLADVASLIDPAHDALWGAAQIAYEM